MTGRDDSYKKNSCVLGQHRFLGAVSTALVEVSIAVVPLSSAVMMTEVVDAIIVRLLQQLL